MNSIGRAVLIPLENKEGMETVTGTRHCASCASATTHAPREAGPLSEANSASRLNGDSSASSVHLVANGAALAREEVGDGRLEGRVRRDSQCATDEEVGERHRSARYLSRRLIPVHAIARSRFEVRRRRFLRASAGRRPRDGRARRAVAVQARGGVASR